MKWEVYQLALAVRSDHGGRGCRVQPRACIQRDSSGRQNLVGLTRGLQGSGKSSLARLWMQQDPERRVRINRDDLRAELPHGKTACQGGRRVKCPGATGRSSGVWGRPPVRVGSGGASHHLVGGSGGAREGLRERWTQTRTGHTLMFATPARGRSMCEFRTATAERGGAVPWSRVDVGPV